MKTKNIQSSLLISQVVITLCLLFHVGDRQTFEDTSRTVAAAQVFMAQVEKRK